MDTCAEGLRAWRPHSATKSGLPVASELSSGCSSPQRPGARASLCLCQARMLYNGATLLCKAQRTSSQVQQLRARLWLEII